LLRKDRRKTAIFSQKPNIFEKQRKNKVQKILCFCGFGAFQTRIYSPGGQISHLTYTKTGFKMHSIKGADGTT